MNAHSSVIILTLSGKRLGASLPSAICHIGSPFEGLKLPNVRRASANKVMRYSQMLCKRHLIASVSRAAIRAAGDVTACATSQG